LLSSTLMPKQPGLEPNAERESVVRQVRRRSCSVKGVLHTLWQPAQGRCCAIERVLWVARRKHVVTIGLFQSPAHDFDGERRQRTAWSTLVLYLSFGIVQSAWSRSTSVHVIRRTSSRPSSRSTRTQSLLVAPRRPAAFHASQISRRRACGAWPARSPPQTCPDPSSR
jgi:hypothetical protein